jgi:hypothetical protein
VTGRDVSSGDMPDFPWPGRLDAPPIGDASLAALLAGAELPACSPPELQPLSEAMAALTAGAASDELAGEAAALAAFREGLGVRGPGRRSHRRPALLSSLPAKAAAAAAIAALSLGGLATAAYARALPAPLQGFAHTTFGAPAVAAHTGSNPSPASPAAAGATAGHATAGHGTAGHAARGLCTAWARAKAHGSRKQTAVAFRNLAAAAGGTGQVAAYCATVPNPRASASSQPHRSGKPATHPTPHGSGKPSSHP